MASISISVNGVKQSVESEIRPTQIFAENAEIVVCAVAVVLAAFALYKILKKLINKPADNQKDKSGDEHE